MKMYGFAYAMGFPCLCFGKNKDFVTTGWSVYLGNYVIFVEFERPKM